MGSSCEVHAFRVPNYKNAPSPPMLTCSQLLQRRRSLAKMAYLRKRPLLLETRDVRESNTTLYEMKACTMTMQDFRMVFFVCTKNCVWGVQFRGFGSRERFSISTKCWNVH